MDDAQVDYWAACDGLTYALRDAGISDGISRHYINQIEKGGTSAYRRVLARTIARMIERAAVYEYQEWMEGSE